MTLPRGRISWPGRGMYTSPPSVLGMGERACVLADSQKRLAIISRRASLRDSVEYESSGNPARLIGTRTLIFECPVRSPWTSSMKSSKPSVTNEPSMFLYFAKGLPSALWIVFLRISSDAMSDLQKSPVYAGIREMPCRAVTDELRDDDLHDQPCDRVRAQVAGS